MSAALKERQYVTRVSEIAELYGVNPESPEFQDLQEEINARFDLTRGEDFLDYLIEEAHAFEKDIKTILKAVGLDGRPTGFESVEALEKNLKNLKNGNDFDIENTFSNRDIERTIRKTINASEYGVEQRIERLLSYARSTDKAVRKIMDLPHVKRQAKQLDRYKKTVFDKASAQEKSKYNEAMLKYGYDFFEDPVQQMDRGIRLEIWREGPDFFDACLKQTLNDYIDAYSTASQKRQRALKEKNLAKMAAKAEKQKQKPRNILDLSKRLKKAPSLTIVEEPEEGRQAETETPDLSRKKLSEILQMAQEDLARTRAQIAIEEDLLPQNKHLWTEQRGLLGLARKDFQTVQSTLLEMEEKKQGLLEAMSRLGADTQGYETPPEIKNLIQSPGALRPLPEAGDVSGNVRSLPRYDNADLLPFAENEEAESVCREIRRCRAECDDALGRYFRLELQNIRLTDWTVQAERDMEKLLTKTDLLADAQVEVGGDLLQLKSLLDDLKNQKSIESNFNAESRYPPLAKIRGWIKDNLDPARIVVHSQAVKNTEKSQYRDPDLIYQALEVLAREHRDQRMSGEEAADGHEIKERREEYLEKLKILELSDVSSSSDQYNRPSLKRRYTVSVEGTDYFLKQHLRKGIGTDKRDYFRLYFAWDEVNSRIIVGHMPDHLPTAFE